MPSREELNGLYDQAKAQGKPNNPRENILWFHTIRPREVHFNTTRVFGRNPVSIQGTYGSQRRMCSWDENLMMPSANALIP